MPTNKSIYLKPPKTVAADNIDDSIIRALNVQSFEKADFDNNGQTDLLFNGYIDYYPSNKDCFRITVVILSFGNGSFKVICLGLELEGLFSAKTISLNGKPYLKTIAIRKKFDAQKKELRKYSQTDTLMFKSGNFIEKSEILDYKVNHLKFCVFRPFFPPQEFCEIINGDSIMLDVSSRFYGGSSIDSGGVFKAKMDSIIYSKISDLLQYMNPDRLEDSYTVDAKDAGNVVLEITYNNGKFKKVSDYGMTGTFALSALEGTLISLLETLPWKKVENLQFKY